jgi:pimeloyl-ACP methyl ester carboxylesterase
MRRFDSALAHGQFVEFSQPVGTIRAHYHEAGSGDQHIVLVQSGGAGSSAYMTWYRTLAPFAEAGYHVLAPDMIGFGLSEIVGQPGKRINSTEYLVGFMDTLGVLRAHFMGNSMGSNAISRLAVDAPDRVRSVIFTGGEPRVDSDETRAISRELGKTARVEFVREMFSKPEVTFADMRQATVAFFYDVDHPAVDEVTAMRLEAVRRPGVHEREREAAFGQIARGRETFESNNLAQIQAPTYLIHGRDERNFYAPDIAPILLESAIRACLVVPDCSCTVLSHCGHWPQIEQAAVFNTLALQFIDTLP